MNVNLSKILEAMEFTNSENAAYVNVNNGEIVLLSDSDISAAEDDSDIEDHPEWQRENIVIARILRAYQIEIAAASAIMGKITSPEEIKELRKTDMR